ncbi:MAG: hypothetical protein ONA90_06345, partial [candidate division KSB1 bacterium]|nr:hypothetical protein [candidate division KSB1 bacterium]
RLTKTKYFAALHLPVMNCLEKVSAIGLPACMPTRCLRCGIEQTEQKLRALCDCGIEGTEALKLVDAARQWGLAGTRKRALIRGELAAELQAG